MRKFVVNRDPKKIEPSKEQIDRYKDFTRLHHEYERLLKRGKKPLYRDPKLFMLIFIILLVLFLVYLESR